MKDKLEKKNKFIHFIEKWFVIGIILFVLIQLTAVGVFEYFVPKNQRLSDKQYEEYNKDYLGHWYNGTFFINMTVSENFESQEKYEEMVQKEKNNVVSRICTVSGTVSFLISLTLLVVASIKERKNKLLEGKTPNIIIFSGLFFLIFKIIEEIDLFIDVSYWREYSTGFLSTTSYYPMMNYIFILPILLIILGLVLRQRQRKYLKLSTKNNERFIKTICTLVIVFGLSFIIYRFGVRVYELFNLNSNSNIRLPFYNFIFDLPRNFAKSTDAYSRLIILRFIKDLPIFITSFVSIILFIKIVLSSINGKIVSEENKKKYKIIIIMLIISSFVFNVLGLFEVKLLNDYFMYQYKDAVYTIAIRSLCEPLLYGLFIYSFKHYVEVGYILNNNSK